MKKKEQFLLCVFYGALAADLQAETCNAQTIAMFARDIPEEKIPHCPMNAAKVFLAYCSGKSTLPFKWMLLHSGE